MIDKLLITCLQRNKRLVVPTLGAFIRKSIDGVGIVLVFVPFLNKDDGVLLNSFKDWAGVDSNDARQMLEEYVSHIKTTLDKRGEYVIEGIGVLRYDANGSLYLAKEGSPKKEEVEREEPKQIVVKKVESKQVEPAKPIAEQVIIENPKQIEPEQEIIAPPQITTPQHVEDLNSRFAPQQQSQPQQQFQQQIPQPYQQQFQQNQQQSLNDIKSTQQQYPATTQENMEPQQPYRKVVQNNNDFQPQRRQANVGAVYFTGDENNIAKEQEPDQIPQQQQQQQYIQQQQQQQRQMTGQERTNALYGTNRKPNTLQQPAAQRISQPQSSLNQAQRNNSSQMQGGGNSQMLDNVNAQMQGNSGQQIRRPANPRIQQKINKNKMPASAKLIWILAIVAIALTISVIIYAVIYGDEVPLADEIQIEQTTTPATDSQEVPSLPIDESAE